MFALTAVVLIGASFTAAMLTLDQRSASNRIIRSEKLRAATEGVRRDMSDLESVDQALLLYDDPRGDKRRTNAIDHLDVDLKGLVLLTNDSPTEKQSVVELKRLITQYRKSTNLLSHSSYVRAHRGRTSDLLHQAHENLAYPLARQFDDLTSRAKPKDAAESASWLSDPEHLTILLVALNLTVLLFGIALFVDVKQRNQARREREREITESNQRLTASLEGSHDAFIRLDSEWRYVYVNQEAEKIVGRSRDELLGKVIWDIFPGEISGVFHKNCLSAARKRQAKSFETEMANGSWLECRVFPIDDGVSVYYRDITVAKNASLSVELARDEAIAANRVKSNFLATMSHEIRTPLNGILGLIDLILATNLDETQRRYVNSAKNSSETLFRVINDVLELSKIEAGKLSVTPRPMDLVKTVQETAELFYGKAKEKNLDLKVVFADNLDRELILDDLRLKQVLGNLIGNAVKFTESGTVAIRVRTEREIYDQVLVRFDIKDTGPGIPSEMLSSIFDSFTQADQSTARRYEGTGLGLSISQHLVELMGGKIRVETAMGKGTHFFVDLIAARPVVSVGWSESKLPEETPTGQRLKLDGANILLADDNDVNVLVAMSLLEEVGCIVDVAENGKQAVEMSAVKAYDLILMDVRMPVMDGRVATQTIRAREAGTGKRTPIIALTASVLDEDRKECVEAGMDDFLPKPICKEDVIEAVARLMLVRR